MESRIELAARIDPQDAADALTRWLDEAPGHRTRWHAALVTVLAPGRNAVVRDASVLAVSELSPLELEGEEPAAYMATVSVNADVEVEEEDGPVVEEYREVGVPLQLTAIVAPSGEGEDVELIVEDVAPPPEGLAD